MCLQPLYLELRDWKSRVRSRVAKPLLETELTLPGTTSILPYIPHLLGPRGEGAQGQNRGLAGWCCQPRPSEEPGAQHWVFRQGSRAAGYQGCDASLGL